MRFLRGKYEKIVSSAADRPKLVVRGHALTENVKLQDLGVPFPAFFAGNFR